MCRRRTAGEVPWDADGMQDLVHEQVVAGLSGDVGASAYSATLKNDHSRGYALAEPIHRC